jgi:NADPH:quinone reductase-like Zn-dependent oxidoreductase
LCRISLVFPARRKQCESTPLQRLRPACRLFEPSLKALRYGGRQIAISGTKDRRVSFDLVEFYHNGSRLLGVDTIRFTGTEIANLMNDLRAGFQEGYLRPPAIRTWPLERGVEAYELVAKGGTPARQVLIPGTTEQP